MINNVSNLRISENQVFVITDSGITSRSQWKIVFYNVYGEIIKQWFYPQQNSPIKSWSFEKNQRICGSGELVFSYLDFPIPGQAWVEFIYNDDVVYSGFIDNVVDPKSFDGKIKITGWYEIIEGIICNKCFSDQSADDILSGLINAFININYNYLGGLISYSADNIDTGSTDLYNSDNSKFRDFKEALEEIVNSLDDRRIGINQDRSVVVYQKEDTVTHRFNRSNSDYQKVEYEKNYKKIKFNRLFVFRKLLGTENEILVAITGNGILFDADGNIKNAQKYIGLKEEMYTFSDNINYQSQLYAVYNDATNKYLKYTYYDGANWNPAIIQSGHTVQKCVIKIDCFGFLHGLYFDAEAETLQYINNSSGSWVDTNIQGVISAHFDLFISLSGQVFITYYSEDEDYLALVTVQSDGNLTTEIIEDAGGIGWNAKLVVDTNNSPHIICGNDNDNYPYHYYLDNGVWSNEKIDVAEGIYIDGVAVGLDDIIYILLHDDDGEMNIISQSYNSSPWLCNSVAQSDSGAICLDYANNVNICYYLNATTSLRHAVYKLTPLAIGEINDEEIESVGDIGIKPSVTVDINNYLCVTYRSATDTSLKFATNATGSWVCSEIDNTADVGLYSSICTENGSLEAITIALGRTNVECQKIEEAISVSKWNIDKWLPEINTCISIDDQPSIMLRKIINCEATTSDDNIIRADGDTPVWTCTGGSLAVVANPDYIGGGNCLKWSGSSVSKSMDYDFFYAVPFSFIEKIGIYLRSDIAAKFQFFNDTATIDKTFYLNKVDQFCYFDFATLNIGSFQYLKLRLLTDVSPTIYVSGIYAFGKHSNIYTGSISQINIKADKSIECSFKLNNYNQMANDKLYVLEKKLKKLEQAQK